VVFKFYLHQNLIKIIITPKESYIQIHIKIILLQCTLIRTTLYKILKKLLSSNLQNRIQTQVSKPKLKIEKE
jgi:hypothetical protein